MQECPFRRSGPDLPAQPTDLLFTHILVVEPLPLFRSLTVEWITSLLQIGAIHIDGPKQKHRLAVLHEISIRSNEKRLCRDNFLTANEKKDEQNFLHSCNHIPV